MMYASSRHKHISVATQRKRSRGSGNFTISIVSSTMQSFSTTFVMEEMITSFATSSDIHLNAVLLVPTTVRI